MYILAFIIVVYILYSLFKPKKAPLSGGFSEPLDESQLKALDLMENTKESILLTGRAGTGKSRVLQDFKKTTKKKIAVLAYTGVAALNIKGQTIHSFFNFGISITPNTVQTRDDQTMYKKLDAIVIDEISMVRADLMDCIDIFLRKNGPNSELPFGGVQMIFIGDPFQLPPIVKPEERHIFEGHPYSGPYFFNAKVFERGFDFTHLELIKIHRQHDPVFINFLNAIRDGSHSNQDLDFINQRHDPIFDETKEGTHVHLMTTNQMALDFNLRKLSRLKGEPFTSYAVIQGEWKQSDYPTDDPLKLKVGSQIMLLNNDPEKRWVNGDIGKILKIKDKDGIIEVKIVGGKNPKESVGKYKWDRGQHTWNEESGQIEYEEDGATFTQYPMKLAWAITIHKSQGKTFDEVVINFGNGTFAHGQAYVALSRSRTFEKTTLRKRVIDRDILIDQKVIDFMQNLEQKDLDDLNAENKE